MGIANDYYKILEEESQGFYQDIDNAKRKSLRTKYLTGTTKMLANIGVNPYVAAIGTSIGSLIGGKSAAESHFFEHLLKNHQGLGSFLDAAALSPYVLMRMANQAENLKSHKQEQNYFVKGNNWQDYGVKAQSLHALRTVSKLANTASLLGIAGGIITGQPGIAAAASSLSPYLLNYKIGTGLAHVAGAGINVGSHAVGGLLNLFGAHGSGAAVSQLGNLLGTFLGGPTGSMLGGMLTSMALSKFMKTLTPKTANIVSVAPLNEPGVSELMTSSTYKVYSNTIRMLQGQGLLKPSESLMLSILNDINLNTHALIPIYSKFLGNSKEVSQQQHINTWSALFNDNPENFTKNKAMMFGLNESNFNIRKAMFKTLTSAELWAEGLLYKIPGARFLTGMSKEEFEEKKKDLLFGNDNRARAEEAASLKTGISLSTIRLLNTKADKWLNAPDYESRMLGLTAGIYEFARFIAQHTGKAQDALGIYDKTLNELNYKDMLNYNFMDDENKKWYQKIPVISDLIHNLNPVNLTKDLIVTPLKAIVNLKSHFKKNLGIADFEEIQSAYESNKNLLKNKFDVKRSAETYLGKYLPDHMTQIIYYLKMISTNIKDMLDCWDCKITSVKSPEDKWRGRYGKYMSDEDYDKRIKGDAYRLTRNQLGIKTRSSLKGLSGFAAKVMGINKKTLNEDTYILKSLFQEDFGLGKINNTAEAEQQKLKKDKKEEKLEKSIEKTPKLLEKMFNWFKKHDDTNKKEEILKDATAGASGFSLLSLFKFPKKAWELGKIFFKYSKKIILPLLTLGQDLIKHMPITSRLINTLSKMYKGFVSNFDKLLHKTKDFIAKKWQDLKSVAGDAWVTVKTTAGKVWDKVKTKAGSIWDSITSPFKKAWNWTKNKVSGAVNYVKDKASKVWDVVSDAAKKVLGKFKAEADKLKRIAKKLIPSKEDIKILLDIVKEKLPKWLIRKEGESVAARFMASLGATLTGFVSGGLPGILMTLVDLYMWGDLAWEVYLFIKNEYFKETKKTDTKKLYKFKSSKISFEDGSDFIDTVEDDEHASALFEHHWFSKNKVNFSTSNLYKFLKKGGSIQELQNIYKNAKKFDRLENGSEDSKRVQALINLSKSGKLKNVKDEKQLEQLINDEIKKEQQRAQLNGKIQAGIVHEHLSELGNINKNELKELVKHLKDGNNLSIQGTQVLAQLLSNLNNILSSIAQIESDSNQALKQMPIPDLSKS